MVKSSGSERIADGMKKWLDDWERALTKSLNNTQPYESIGAACEYHVRKQMIYCIRMTKDQLKELREEANAE